MFKFIVLGEGGPSITTMQKLNPNPGAISMEPITSKVETQFKNSKNTGIQESTFSLLEPQIQGEGADGGG